MTQTENFPTVSFRIDTGNISQDVDVSTSLFNEVIGELAKNDVAFDIKVNSGSIDFVIKILIDFVDQILADPNRAAIFTAVLSGVVGAITQKIFDSKDMLKKIRANKAWRFLAKLKRKSNENVKKQVPLVTVEKEKIKFSLEKVNGKIVHLYYEFNREEPTYHTADEKELEELIIRNGGSFRLGNLILLSLWPKKRLIASEIKSKLGEWGREQGQGFYASGTINSLINRKLVQKGFRAKGRGNKEYSLTGEGQKRAAELIDKLRSRK